MDTVHIPARRGASFRVEAGERFRVIDPEGGQVSDMAAFNADDVAERFSPKYTYTRDRKLRVTTGDTLYTTEGRPILSIASDDCGVHDFLYSPCTEWILEEFYDRDGQGCRENLHDVLADEGVEERDLHEAMNVFMNTNVTDDWRVEYFDPVTEPGDAIEFEAEMDALVGLTACAAESAVNAGDPGPIDVEVPAGRDVTTNF